jgi:hypothetical protein
MGFFQDRCALGIGGEFERLDAFDAKGFDDGFHSC